MLPSPTGMKWNNWYGPPFAESVKVRFSEMKLSSSNFPTLTVGMPVSLHHHPNSRKDPAALGLYRRMLCE